MIDKVLTVQSIACAKVLIVNSHVYSLCMCVFCVCTLKPVSLAG